MIDTYKNMMGGLESPARESWKITPDDTTDLPKTTRSIHVGGSGDISVHIVGESVPVVFKRVPSGILPIRVDRVLSTGTTCTDLTALWHLDQPTQ